MAARKTRTQKLPADVSDRALIRVEVSFNGMRRDDETETELDAQVMSWANAGLVTILHTWTETANGKDPAGPGSTEPSVPVDGADGGGHSGAPGGEQS